MIKLIDLLHSILPETRIPNRYIAESKQVVKEISLNPSNAYDITYEGDGGYFSTGDIEYTFNINQFPNQFTFPGDSTQTEFVGGMLDIGFTPTGDNLTEPKGGRENLIKIYSTIFKVILEIASKYKPTYLSISCTDSSGYFPIYSQLTKTNKIPGYHRKTVISWKHYQLNNMHTIVLTKNNLK